MLKYVSPNTVTRSASQKSRLFASNVSFNNVNTTNQNAPTTPNSHILNTPHTPVNPTINITTTNMSVLDDKSTPTPKSNNYLSFNSDSVKV